MFLGKGVLIISHVGDSSVVFCYSLNAVHILASMYSRKLAFLNCEMTMSSFFPFVEISWMQVISRTGKAEILTGPHRPYGNNRVSLEEVKRIRAAGGWVCLFISSED